MYVEYMINYAWICVGGTSFHICHHIQSNNSIGKVGKAILRLHNRERSYAFCGKELQSVVERRDHLTNTTLTVFQVSIVQYFCAPRTFLSVQSNRKITNKRLVYGNTWGVWMFKIGTELNSLHLFQLFRIIHICMIQ